MLALDVKIGQAVQIGDAACIKVLGKNGQRVRLSVATAVMPIRILASGIIPQQFVAGIHANGARPAPPRLAATG